METTKNALSKIQEHFVKAVQKHNKFADVITDSNNLKMVKECLRKVRFVNENGKPVVADELLDEEYLEIIEAYLEGRKQDAVEECYDAIAVLLRMALMIENEVENG